MRWQPLASDDLRTGFTSHLLERPFFVYVCVFFLTSRLPEFLGRSISLPKRPDSIASYLNLPKAFELPALLLAVILICGAEIGYSYFRDLKLKKRVSAVAALLSVGILWIAPFDAIFYGLLAILITFALSEGVSRPESAWYPARRGDVAILLAFSAFLAVGSAVFFLNTRIVYFSFHLAEYSLLSRFWEFGQNILEHWPRHGLYEVVLGKWLHHLTGSWDATGFISEYLIKCGTILDFAIFGWFVVRVTGSRTQMLLALATFPFIYHLLGFAHVFPIIGVILLLTRATPNVALPAAAFASLVWFVLRTDFGLFSLASVFLAAVLYYRESISRFVTLIAVGVIVFAGLCYGLLGASPVSYLKFILVDLAPHNKALLGSPAIDFSSHLGRQVLLQIVIAATALMYCYRAYKSRQTAAALVYSAGLLLCNFQLLTSRSDGHVYTVAALFNGVILLPYIQKSRQLAFLLWVGLIHCTSFFVIPHSGQSEQSITAALDPKTAIAMGKRMKEGVFPGSYTPAEATQLRQLVAKHQDKVTFAHLLPYEYVVFNTRPLGRIADSLHGSPGPLRAEYLGQINRSELVLLEESNMDGFPDKERYEWFYQNLGQNFEYSEKIGPLSIYRNRWPNRERIWTP